MDGARIAGAAMRRRERRLRSWAKHERMTVAMALAENLHHSRQKVEGDEHDGPRAQKTARVTGARPGVLTEPEPQGEAVTVGYVAAPGPLLVVASLAGGDEVDATTVSHLLKAALVKKEEERKAQERKERVMQEIHRKVRADEAVTDVEWAAWKAWRGIGSSSSSGQKRKRKKRRKRKLPRNSSYPRLAARHLTCSVLVLPEECCGGFFWEITSGFLSVFSAIWFDSGCMCLSVFGGVGLAGCGAPRAVFLRGFQALVRCIMASMDQQEQFVYWSCLMCTGFLDFMGDDFMLVSVFNAELGSTADTCTASVYGAEEFHVFLSEKVEYGS